MTVASTSASPPPWLLLAFSLPRKGASLRVAVWRKLQRYGAVPLGNSGYVLPNDAGNRERYEWLATTIRGSQGEASVLEVQSIDHLSGARIEKRFSEARKQDYLALLKLLRNADVKRPETTRLRQRFQEIVSIDFFGSPFRERVEKALEALEKPQAGAAAPDQGKISRSAYLNRSWVTRPRPGIDRVTSAWLIRRFIDPKARFVFAAEGRAPDEAVPFDMYQGGFGHRGEDCTFETLSKAFRIRDKRVALMGEMVHDADLFDEKFGRKEGFGIDEVMKGWARAGSADSDLLERGMEMAEGLYESLAPQGRKRAARSDQAGAR